LQLKYEHWFLSLPEVKAKVVEAMREGSTPLQFEASGNCNAGSCSLTFLGNGVNAVFNFSTRVNRLSRAFEAVPVVELRATFEGDPTLVGRLVKAFKNSFELKLLRGGG